MADDTFDPAALTKAAEDTFTVRRVFGEAYERDGVTVIPVARVTGLTGLGSGGGEGEGLPMWARPRTSPDEPPHAEPGHPADNGTGHGSGHGGGGGWGLHVKPLGVYVVDATGAHWRPAIDVNHLMLGMQVVAAWGLTVGLTAWALRRRR